MSFISTWRLCFGLMLRKKVSDVRIMIYSCYLPPENSRNAKEFFGQMLTQIYMHNYVDYIFICGDVNGRIGNLRDFVVESDDRSEWTVIDKEVNGHGKSFIDFLKDARCCVVNG